jgi:hypothetical protein
LRQREHSRQASLLDLFFDLFFDLAFIVTLMTMSKRLVHKPRLAQHRRNGDPVRRRLVGVGRDGLVDGLVQPQRADHPDARPRRDVPRPTDGRRRSGGDRRARDRLRRSLCDDRAEQRRAEERRAEERRAEEREAEERRAEERRAEEREAEERRRTT